MKIDWNYLTHKGERQINEDAFVFFEEEGRFLFVLADGLGAHEKGEEGSAFVCSYIKDKVSNTSKIDLNELSHIAQLANTALIDYQKGIGIHQGLRTTLLILLLTDESFMYVNVGDTRLYQFERNHIIFQTQDHSVCQKLVDIGQMKTSAIRSHPDRHRLLSVLGDTTELPKLNSGVLKKVPGAFLLCTDGLWESVTELVMEIDLHKSESPDEWLKYLVKRAFIQSDSNMDNVTAVAIFVE